jgi:polyhydroxyalkanoate synthesis regulator phasin
MDYENLTEEEAKQRERELVEDAREAKEELEAKQSEALEAIAEGGDLEEYATVELGELEIEVLGWLPGDVEDTVLQARQLGKTEDPAKIKRSMETMLSALAEMTVDDTYNMAFWRQFYQEYGAAGLIEAVGTVLEPAQTSMEEKREAVDGFRQRKG